VSRIVERNLRVEFSDEELANKRDELATVIIGAHTVEEEKAIANKGYKEALEALYSRRDVLAHQIKAKGEHRPVQCAVDLNTPSTGIKRVTRMDTGELVEEVPMTDDERQGNLIDELERLASTAPTQAPVEPEPPEPVIPEAELTFRSFQDIAAVIVALDADKQAAAITEMTERLAAKLVAQGKIMNREGQSQTIASPGEAQELAHSWLTGCVMLAKEDSDGKADAAAGAHD
jgi:hypothetical protein